MKTPADLVSETSSDPDISVIIATRDRADHVERAVASVLANAYGSFTVTVVDQSSTDTTAQVLGGFDTDPRFRYVHSDTRGLSAGRNHGCRVTGGGLVAFTDDDCEVREDWLAALAEAFSVDQRIGVVFGNVHAAATDAIDGFIPTYERAQPYLAKSFREKHRVEGIGACMAVRRHALVSLSGFDEMLGVGAPFRAAEELDFVLRALAAGYFVYETPSAAVIHHGYRDWSDGARLIEGYLFGIGAAVAKQVKCRRWAISHVLVQFMYRWTLARQPVKLGDRPFRGARLAGFVRGVAAGFRTPINRANGHFAPHP